MPREVSKEKLDYIIVKLESDFGLGFLNYGKEFRVSFNFSSPSLKFDGSSRELEDLAIMEGLHPQLRIVQRYINLQRFYQRKYPKEFSEFYTIFQDWTSN